MGMGIFYPPIQGVVILIYLNKNNCYYNIMFGCCSVYILELFTAEHFVEGVEMVGASKNVAPHY
jgi:hypothetical protein